MAFVINRIFLITCAYAYEIWQEKKNTSEFKKWLFSEPTEQKLKSLGVDLDKIDLLIASRDDKLSLIDEDTGTKIPHDEMLDKGNAIRMKFLRLKKEKLKPNDLIVYIDGDGQIDMNMVIKLIEELKVRDYVLACRAHKLGIDDKRGRIESFENFLVSRRYNIDLPDAQCGCWGFRGHILRKIFDLCKGKGFEIELDILSSILQIKGTPTYIKVNIKDPEISTTFKDEHHKRKLRFLLGKIHINPFMLRGCLQKFILERKVELPTEYLSLFNSDYINTSNTKKIDFPKEKNKKKFICIDKINCDKSKLPKWHVCKQMD